MRNKRGLFFICCLVLVLMVCAGCQGGSDIPAGVMSVSDLKDNPVYDTQIQVYGKVSLLGELFCPCFQISSDGGTIEVWYGLMVEEDGTEWATVDVEGIENGDTVIVKGELKDDGGMKIWAVSIEKNK